MTNNDHTKTDSNRLIRIDEVLTHLPISKSTWWEGVRTGKFPKPIKLGERITCWRLEEVLRLTKHNTDAASSRE